MRRGKKKPNAEVKINLKRIRRDRRICFFSLNRNLQKGLPPAANAALPVLPGRRCATTAGRLGKGHGGPRAGGGWWPLCQRRPLSRTAEATGSWRPGGAPGLALRAGSHELVPAHGRRAGREDLQRSLPTQAVL